MEPKLFYQLRFMPFLKESPYKKMFESEDTRQMKSRLEYLKKCKGIGVFTGNPGTGKSSIIREFLAPLNKAIYKIVYINMTTTSTLEFYRQLAYGLGIDPAHRKSDIFKQIHEVVDNMQHGKRMTPILALDESQYMSNAILQDIKLLLNFDFDSKNQMIVIFCGETSFAGMLEKGIHEALRQRVIINYKLTGLTYKEAFEYVDFCLKQAGAKEPVFLPEAIEAAYKSCGGSYRVLNNLLEKSMIGGANKKERPIGIDTVLEAQNEVELTL